MNALLQSTLMSLENSHWPQQFLGTSGVVEIKRSHIKLVCVLIILEIVSLVSRHIYPKWTNTHLHWPFSLERQFWSPKSWSCYRVITNAILSLCRNSCFGNRIERQTLSNLFFSTCVLSKEIGWGISRASEDKNSSSKYSSLGCFSV